MKNYFLILIALALFASCGNTRPQLNCTTYTESADPDSTDYSADWQKVKGMNVSFGSINTRYAKATIPTLETSMKWSGTAWRGERIASQLVIWTPEELKQVECVFSPFTSAEGAVMDASIAKSQFVRYVITDSFGPGCAVRDHLVPSLVADVIDPIACLDVEAQSTRPVWLTFDVPTDAKAGIYTGTLEVYARDKEVHKLEVTLEVIDRTLPATKDWKYHLDLWQHPTSVARVAGVEVWSEEHWKLMETPMRMLAEGGQKVITATLNKEPWNHQCYDAYADMIVWTKKKDGSWLYDYKIFDRWVNFMMDLGIKNYINCYSMAPWNHELHYFDEEKGEFVDISAAPDTPEFRQMWVPFLTDFSKHLDEKGWLEITNIAMDERSPEIMKGTLDVLKEAGPKLGVSLADNHRSYKQYPWLTDICVEYGATFEDADLQYRKDNGLISTLYVYCATEFPNAFTFSDPAESTYISWHAMSANYDGFLRWAYNSWNENPLLDSRYKTWSAGDAFIVYPDGRSSIRFERLREGIQDFEKMRILKEEFAKDSDTTKLDKLNAELKKFNVIGKPAKPCSEMVDEGKKLLLELSR